MRPRLPCPPGGLAWVQGLAAAVLGAAKTQPHVHPGGTGPSFSSTTFWGVSPGCWKQPPQQLRETLSGQNCFSGGGGGALSRDPGRTASKTPKPGEVGLEPSEAASGGGVPARRGGSAPFLPRPSVGAGQPSSLSSAQSQASKAPGAAPETPEGFLGSATMPATWSAQGTECSLGSDCPVASPRPKADAQRKEWPLRPPPS